MSDKDGTYADFPMLHSGASHVSEAHGQMGLAHQMIESISTSDTSIFGGSAAASACHGVLVTKHSEGKENIYNAKNSLNELETKVKSLIQNLKSTDESNAGSIDTGFKEVGK